MLGPTYHQVNVRAEMEDPVPAQEAGPPAQRRTGVSFSARSSSSRPPCLLIERRLDALKPSDLA